VAVEVEGEICWLWKLRRVLLVAVGDEGGICWLCKKLREGSGGCGR
jgi:hypothetical protein